MKNTLPLLSALLLAPLATLPAADAPPPPAKVEATQPAVAAKFAELKAELARLQKEYKDDGQYTDPATWPKTSADGPFDAYKPMGIQTIAKAITSAAVK